MITKTEKLRRFGWWQMYPPPHEYEGQQVFLVVNFLSKFRGFHLAGNTGRENERHLRLMENGSPRHCVEENSEVPFAPSGKEYRDR